MTNYTPVEPTAQSVVLAANQKPSGSHVMQARETVAETSMLFEFEAPDAERYMLEGCMVQCVHE